MTPSSLSVTPRILLSRLLPLGLAATAVAASVTAVLVEDDGVDTALGAVTGAAVVLLLLALLLRLIIARVDRRERDRQALDGLEPLRAARRDSGRTAPPTRPHDASQAQPDGAGPVRDDGPA